MNRKETRLMQKLEDAALSILNVEGAAIIGAKYSEAFKDLDVRYHFNKIREALKEVKLANQE